MAALVTFKGIDQRRQIGFIQFNSLSVSAHSCWFNISIVLNDFHCTLPLLSIYSRFELYPWVGLELFKSVLLMRSLFSFEEFEIFNISTLFWSSDSSISLKFIFTFIGCIELVSFTSTTFGFEYFTFPFWFTKH